jgi:pimeloyl-ACP methyl ester carboxylesterase
MREVILTHGLWVPGVVMHPLAWRLAQAGFRCRTFSYSGMARPLEVHAERLARFAQAVGPAHYIGHSLGGLVVMEALQRHPELPVGRVVLLGTPARGCAAGRRLARLPAGRWFLGQSEPLWRDDRASHWHRPEPLGVIAGSLPIGLARVLGRLPGMNDGVVEVDETPVEGMAERVVLPVGHSAMLLSARVAEKAAMFLGEGRFSAPPR